jgi:hypothetical protein
LGVGAGAVAGAVTGAVVAIGSGWWHNNLSAGKIWGGITSGAVSGAITGGLATGDPSVIAVIGAGALAGGIGAAAGSVVEQAVDNHGHVDGGKVLTDGIGGAVGGGVGAPIGKVLGKHIGDQMVTVGGGLVVATAGGPPVTTAGITVIVPGAQIAMGTVVSIAVRAGTLSSTLFMAANDMAAEEAKEVYPKLRYRPSAKFEHDQYVQQVRPGAKEKTFYPGSGRTQGGLGSRRYDDFDSKTGTAYEGNTTPWSWITPKKLQEKLHQVASDILLLKNRRSGVKKVIWFGTDPLPTKGPAAQLKIALEEAGIDYQVILP